MIESGEIEFDKVQVAFGSVVNFSFKFLVKFFSKESTLKMYIFAHVTEVLSVGFVWEMEFF
jgi:hypothetical protein